MWRLLREYAFRYWLPLLLGLVATFIMGGAMAAGLRVMDVSFNVLDAGTHEAQVPVVQTTGTTAEVPSSVAAPATDRKAEKKAGKFIDKMNNVLRKLGLAPIEADQMLDMRTVILLITCLLAFFLVQSIGDFCHRYCLKWVGARVVNDLRCKLFDRLTEQSLGFLGRQQVGKLISRCTNDVNAVEEVISESFPDLCTSPILIIVSVEFIWSKARTLQLGYGFVLMVIAIPVIIVPIVLISRLLKRYQQRVLEGISTVTSRMQECFSGIAVIKAFNQEKRESKNFRTLNENYFKRQKKAILASVCIHPTMQFSAVMLAAAFVCVCYHYHVSLEALAIMGFAAQQGYKPLKDLAKINSKILKSAAAVERIFALIDTDTALPVPKDPKAIETFDDAIVYKDVDFCYTAGGPQVLQGIDLTIRKGQLVALVGQTGSGKSTIAHLLARFYDPTAGSVTIDGVSLKDLKMEDLRKMVGIVSQDTFLFNTTIAENISYGRPGASLEEIQQAARQANAEEFINQLPDGYEHVVGERGVLLSGGQRQRIAIARAILRDPPILILDEATSALDTVTERIVQEALNNVMRERTVLAVAHRLSTIQKADLIVVMDAGRIVETGTHQELLAKGGRYKTLHDLQFAKDV